MSVWSHGQQMTYTATLSHGDDEYLATGQPQGIRRFPSQDRRLQQCERVHRDLVREDQKRQTQENLEALLLEATRSGPGASSRRLIGKCSAANSQSVSRSNLRNEPPGPRSVPRRDRPARERVFLAEDYPAPRNVSWTKLRRQFARLAEFPEIGTPNGLRVLIARGLEIMAGAWFSRSSGFPVTSRGESQST